MTPWPITVSMLMAINSDFFHRETIRPQLLPGKCRPIPGTAGGSEDIFTLDNGLAFISSGALPMPGVKGRIILFDFNNTEAGGISLPIIGRLSIDNFFPHGIDIWKDPFSGTVILFVVNHHPGGERVERFKFDEKRRELIHLETIQDPAMSFVNDVAAIDERSFYFSNFWRLPQDYPPPKSYITYLLYLLRLLQPGDVAFYDGYKSTSVVNNITNANGIKVSRDQQYLYVDNWADKELLIFKRISNKTVNLVSVIPLDQHLDNGFEDMYGDLWFAGQLSFPQINFQFLADRTRPASSQVVRLRKNKHCGYEVKEILADDGMQVPSATVANRFQDKLIIGTLFDSAILCDLDNYKK